VERYSSIPILSIEMRMRRRQREMVQGLDSTIRERVIRRIHRVGRWNFFLNFFSLLIPTLHSYSAIFSFSLFWDSDRRDPNSRPLSHTLCSYPHQPTPVLSKSESESGIIDSLIFKTRLNSSKPRTGSEVGKSHSISSFI
jgi:hypothetical protein